MTELAVRLRARRDAHPLVAVGIGAAAWVGLYLANGPPWNWAVYDLAR